MPGQGKLTMTSCRQKSKPSRFPRTKSSNSLKFAQSLILSLWTLTMTASIPRHSTEATAKCVRQTIRCRRVASEDSKEFKKLAGIAACVSSPIPLEFCMSSPMASSASAEHDTPHTRTSISTMPRANTAANFFAPIKTRDANANSIAFAKSTTTKLAASKPLTALLLMKNKIANFF